jgi:hypothetical protein
LEFVLQYNDLELLVEFQLDPQYETIHGNEKNAALVNGGELADKKTLKIQHVGSVKHANVFALPANDSSSLGPMAQMSRQSGWALHQIIRTRNRYIVSCIPSIVSSYFCRSTAQIGCNAEAETQDPLFI